MKNLKPNEILVPAHDHRYRVARIRDDVAVWNIHAEEWCEFAGDEYLGEGDIVVNVKVAQ